MEGGPVDLEKYGSVIFIALSIGHPRFLSPP